MVVYEWFKRISHIVAPDKNFEAYDPDEEEEEVGGVAASAVSFWQVVAPDPRFAPASDEVSFEGVHPPRTPRAGAGGGVPKQAATVVPSQVECQHCHKLTPVKPAMGSGNDDDDILQTPNVSSGGASLLEEQQNLQDHVLTAAKDTAMIMASPPGIRKKTEEAFRIVCSSYGLNPKMKQKLVKKIHNDKEYWQRARSFGLGLNCPDGFTLFQTAAYANNVDAAKIILQELSCDENYRTLLEERTLAGKTAAHIAAERGNLEMIDYLQSLDDEASNANQQSQQQQQQQKNRGSNFMSPQQQSIDLVGRTPFGVAVMSPDPKAQKLQKQLYDKLFSPLDWSVVGSPAPVQQRSTSVAPLRLLYGTSHMPGKRILNEDALLATTLECSSSATTTTPTTKKEIIALLGVCDGHGDGGLVSKYIATKLPTILKEIIEKQGAKNWASILKQACFKIDVELKMENLEGGSTACIACVSETRIVVMNVGDCRAILIQRGTSADNNNNNDTNDPPELTDEGATPPPPESKPSSEPVGFTVIPLSVDHKPSSPEEKARIEKAGLTIEEQRFTVNGMEQTVSHICLSESNHMAVARSFGDFEYKAHSGLGMEEQAVVSVPEIMDYRRDPSKDCFLVIACDGIWDVMSNEDVAQFLLEQVDKNPVGSAILPAIGDLLLTECLKRGSGDNLSCIVAALSHQADQLSGGKSNLKGKTLDFDATATAGDGNNDSSVVAVTETTPVASPPEVTTTAATSGTA